MERRFMPRLQATYTLAGCIVALLCLPVGGAGSPPGDSVHFCVPFDHEQWRREHSLPAAKQPANLNVGEPRTVRMIYFLPNDRPFRQEVVDSMKVVMRRVQTFYAEQMEAHGYGSTTFGIETDAHGEPLVHRVDGEHTNGHYREKRGEIRAIGQVFDLKANVYFIVTDISSININSGIPAVGHYSGKRAGFAFYSAEALLAASRAWHPGKYYFMVMLHELGHTFGLDHDWRDGANIMSYGPPGWDRLSACAAEFLSGHPYFNARLQVEESPRPTIELISSAGYPTGSASVPVRLRVSDSDGLHQVMLYAFGGLKLCQGLSGEQDTIVEFGYDGIIPSSTDPDRIGTSLSSHPVHPIYVRAADSGGDVGSTSFNLFDLSLQRNLMRRLKGHTNSVESVSFSSDGGILASGSLDGTVKLWDVGNGQEVDTLEGHKGGISSVSFSRDGTILASGSSDRTVMLWDVESRKPVGKLEGHTGGVSMVAVSPDGNTVVSSSWDRTVILWRVDTREQIGVLEGHSGGGQFSFVFT